jgi:hypothetical protein
VVPILGASAGVHQSWVNAFGGEKVSGTVSTKIAYRFLTPFLVRLLGRAKSQVDNREPTSSIIELKQRIVAIATHANQINGRLV